MVSASVVFLVVVIFDMQVTFANVRQGVVSTNRAKHVVFSQFIYDILSPESTSDCYSVIQHYSVLLYGSKQKD